MRAPKPLGALVAGSFFALAKAQASAYGNPGGNGVPGSNSNPDDWQQPNGNGPPLPSGNPGDWQNGGNGVPLPPGTSGDPQNPNGNGIPSSPDTSGNWPTGNGAPPSPDSNGNWPSGNGLPPSPNGNGNGNWPSGNGLPPSPDGTGNWPNGNGPLPVPGNSGTWPGGNGFPSSPGNPGDWQNPDGSNAPAPSGSPIEWPSNPSCALQGTTTVFVTVSSSTPANPSPSDGSSTDGTAPDGTSPDETSLDGTSPDGTSPDGTSPDGTSPDGTVPGGTSPDGTSPGGTSPDGTTPNVPAPDGSAPDVPSPNGSGDDTSPAGTSSDGSTPGGADDGSAPDDTSSGGAPPYGDNLPDGTSPDGTSPDGSSPDGSIPSDSGSGNPGDNGQGSPSSGSPSGTGQLPSGPVKPFTTLTIDIWGTSGPPVTVASDASPQATSDDSGVVTGAPPPASSGAVDNGSGQTGGDPGSVPSPNPDDNATPGSGQPGDASGNAPSPNPDGNATPGSGQPGDASGNAPLPNPDGNPNPGSGQPGDASGNAPLPNPDGSSSPDSGQPGDTSGNAPSPDPGQNPAPGDASGNNPIPNPDGSMGPSSGNPDSGTGSNGSPGPDDGSYGNPDESPVFVTDGKPGPSGAGQNLPPSPQITSPGDGSSIPSDGSGPVDDNGQDGNAPYSMTIIGADGQPTIASHPWGHGSQADGQPAPTDVYASSADAQGLPFPISSGGNLPLPSVTNAGPQQGPGGSDSDDSGVITCVTVVGDDGKPTVLDFTVGAPGPAATLGPLPGTALTDGSALAQSMTIIGADGKPTIVSAPWGNPGAPENPGPVITGAPGPDGTGNGNGNGNNGNGGIITSGAQLPDDATTCVTMLGPDGKPTIVDWPFDPNAPGGSGPIATAGPFTGVPGGNGNSNGNGGVLTDGSALPQTGSITAASFTVLGPDGLPTVVQTSWTVSPTDVGSGSGQGPIFSHASISGLPSGISAQLPSPSGLLPDGAPGPDGPDGSDDAATTCYTIIGPDGMPTVIETTGAVPGATGGPVVGPGATLLPPSASDILPLPMPPFPDTASDASPVDGSGNNPGRNPFTTCTTYTVLGPDGLPTVVDTTWVVPPAFETGSALATDASGPLSAPAGQITGAPGAPLPGSDGDITTCSTYTVIGPDGLPSAVETTFVVPAEASRAQATNGQLTSGIQAAPWSAASAGPAPPSAGGPGSPGGDGSAGEGPLTTCITVMTTGTDGILTPVEQTVVIPPASGAQLPDITDQSALPLTTAGLPDSAPTGPVIGNGNSGPGDNGDPNISGYGGDASDGDAGTVAPPGGPVQTGASADPLTAGEPTMTVTGTRTSTLTVIADPTGGPVISGPSGIPLSDYGAGGAGEPLPATALPDNGGAGPSESTLFPAGSVAYGGAGSGGVPVTSTWSNAIPEGTTTYLLKFPLTTLATLPAKRALRRDASVSAWGNSTATASENTSLGASLTSIASQDETASDSLPSMSSESESAGPSQTGAGPAPSMCATGGNIGNHTVNFDGEKTGPLFNPSSDLWFSEGFLIAPPSSQAEQAYFASSGGQLVEFVPAALTPNGEEEGSDVAEVGVGPNASKECYRFDLHGASLGCAAEGAEQWCEFEISAYRWNHETSREESIAWSETKRVPACTSFPGGACALTPVELDGYTNITGVLITLRVGLDLRAWWGDDFRYGWTDNSCEAAACRNGAASHRVKRETVETALRRGVWHWTPEGVERLDDDFIWDAVQ